MKRGFLKTKKAKQRVARAVDSESAETSHKKSKDKGKKGERLDSTLRAEHADFSKIDPHKLPKSVQEQFDNDETCVGYGKKRVIFRSWPRDPKGKAIVPSSLRGKQAGNGLDLWGATLYDFYHVRRLPNVPNYITTSTGSRLAKWMRQAGELIAEDELYWADKEEDPKEIPVVDLGELIRCYDTRVALGIFDEYSYRKKIREKYEKSTGVSSFGETGETTDGDDLISPVDGQGGNTEREQEQEAAPVANDDAEKDATAGVQINEAMQPDQTGETLPDKGAEQPKGEPAASSPNDSFNPADYPSPYPFIPCTHETPTLQQRIPLHLLPQKLHVHDPWNKLSIDKGDSDILTPWISKVANGGDIIRTYSLSLEPEAKEAASKAQKKIAEDEAAKGESVLRIFPAEKEGPTEEPLVEVVLPPRPPKRTQVEEAHLYLQPRSVGSGHHSVVHGVEWELPRDLFAEAYLCRTCVEQDARRQVQKLKDEGKWEALLKGAFEKAGETLEIAPDVRSGTEPSQGSGAKRTVVHITVEEHQLPEVTGSFISQAEVDSANLGDEKSVDANDAETTSASDDDPATGSTSSAAETGGTEVDVKMDAVGGQGSEPGAKVEALDVEMRVDGNEDCKEPSALECAPKEDKGKGKEDNGDEEKADAEGSEEEQSEEEEEIFTIEPPRVIRIASYSGPGLRIHTTVKWRDPFHERCSHSSFGTRPVPRTTMLHVVAKLSLEDDLHLDREAKNYQSFPDHFFQHWNGYNVMPPLHDPVPIGALCPQFYGYYTPDDPTDGTSLPDYLSPILLLENCGREIDPEELSLDDKQECASLVFRFHHAGWLHESFAARNIMWQQGKPTEWPISRPGSSKSFRLIDFGRSIKMDSSLNRANEEEVALRLLHLLHHQSSGLQTETN